MAVFCGAAAWILIGAVALACVWVATGKACQSPGVCVAWGGGGLTALPLRAGTCVGRTIIHFGTNGNVCPPVCVLNRKICDFTFSVIPLARHRFDAGKSENQRGFRQKI